LHFSAAFAQDISSLGGGGVLLNGNPLYKTAIKTNSTAVSRQPIFVSMPFLNDHPPD
jgi:hypothetical protein